MLPVCRSGLSAGSRQRPARSLYNEHITVHETTQNVSATAVTKAVSALASMLVGQHPLCIGQSKCSNSATFWVRTSEVCSGSPRPGPHPWGLKPSSSQPVRPVCRRLWTNSHGSSSEARLCYVHVLFHLCVLHA